eukprot:gene10245-11340_t
MIQHHAISHQDLCYTLSRPDIIPSELLVRELSGELSEHDYFGRSMKVLQESMPNDITAHGEEAYVAVEDMQSLLSTDRQFMEDGYVIRRDGSLYLAVSTDLGDISGKLVDWWFGQCDSDEKFQWWHPKDHGSCIFDAPFYAAMAWERFSGYYVGHTQVVEERLAGQMRRLHYEYLRPGRFFDSNWSDELSCCVVARIHLDDPYWGMLAVGYMLHMVREVNGRNVIRSRYWLGDISFAETPENYYLAQSMNFWANGPLARGRVLTKQFAHALYAQVSEKMMCLRSWLPSLYFRAQVDQRAFREKFSALSHS